MLSGREGGAEGGVLSLSSSPTAAPRKILSSRIMEAFSSWGKRGGGRVAAEGTPGPIVTTGERVAIVVPHVSRGVGHVDGVQTLHEEARGGIGGKLLKL